MNAYIPAPDYNVNNEPPDYQESGPYMPPPDYEQPRLRKVEITSYPEVQQRNVNRVSYDNDNYYHPETAREAYNDTPRRYDGYDTYQTSDRPKLYGPSSSVGRRYQPKTQRRHPSMPPPQMRHSNYKTYSKVSFDDERYEPSGLRDNENFYGSVISRNSSRWCEDCPYCQKMERLEAERLRRHNDSLSQWNLHYQEYSDSYPNDFSTFQEPSYGVINKSNKPLKNLENSNAVRASKFFKAHHKDQLDVKQGELLQVLKKKPDWWKCKNVYGEKGWVPAQNLFLVPKD
uniref:SH3 domain-containing protein n=1 Tax=Syphacia muris TaxID=451379 RepID=A0A0N5AT57_9BILA